MPESAVAMNCEVFVGSFNHLRHQMPSWIILHPGIGLHQHYQFVTVGEINWVQCET